MNASVCLQVCGRGYVHSCLHTKSLNNYAHILCQGKEGSTASRVTVLRTTTVTHQN